MGILDSKHDQLTSAVSALDDLTIIREPSIGQALKIILSVTRPALLLADTHWLVGEEVTDNVFTVQLTLEINQADDILSILLL